MAISKELLAVLCCPSDKGELKLGKKGLTCSKCKKSYPIKDDIPILMP